MQDFVAAEMDVKKGLLEDATNVDLIAISKKLKVRKKGSTIKYVHFITLHDYICRLGMVSHFHHIAGLHLHCKLQSGVSVNASAGHTEAWKATPDLICMYSIALHAPPGNCHLHSSTS